MGYFSEVARIAEYYLGDAWNSTTLSGRAFGAPSTHLGIRLANVGGTAGVERLSVRAMRAGNRLNIARVFLLRGRQRPLADEAKRGAGRA